MSDLAYLDHYTRGKFQPYVREVRTGSGLAMLEVSQPPGDLSDPPTTDLVLFRLMRTLRASTVDHGAGVFAPTS